jgi:hypothetical protein
MTKIKLKHYRVKRGSRGFWEPTTKMKALGFASIPCGPDGPEAWAIAEEWERRWQLTRRGEAPSPALALATNLSLDQAEELSVYPTRSLGAFRRYRRTEEWARKAPRTREDWWRAWRRMKPIFADIDPRTITLEDISAWRKVIEETVSLREAHRALKIWRALWKVCAALDYCIRGADPSLGVRNSAAKGRSEIWAEGEVVRLFKQAWRDRYFGLAALIAVAWSTQLSPGDVRTLKASQLVRRQNGVAFFAERSKTGKPVGGELNDRALAAMEAYLGELGIELHGESYIFRTRTGVPYSKDTLGDDFRAIRSAVFGERERRTLADFRRSGAHEAIAGEATPAALAHAMGNTLSASNALFATYCPVNLTTIRSVMEARRRGRTKLRQNR